MSDGHVDGVEQVVKLKRKLNDAVLQDKEAHILKLLSRLGHTSMTLDILQATHIGKEVNGLRKMQGSVGEKAKSLVKKWKRLVPLATPTNHQSNSSPDLSAGTSHQHPSAHTPILSGSRGEDEFSRALQSAPTMLVTHRQHKDTRHYKSERSNEQQHHHHHSREKNSKHKKEMTERRDGSHQTDMSSTATQQQLSASVNESWRGVSPLHHCESQPGSSSEDTPTSQSSNQKKRKATFETSLDSVSLSKRSRTQIYSGKKRCVTGPQVVPSLFDLSMRILMDNIDAIDEVGGVPYLVLEPVLQKCTPSQLMRLEEFNPHFLEDTDVLWEKHTQKQFKGVKPAEDQTWRELYIERLEAQEEKLKSLAASIKQKEKARKEPVRTTKQVIPTRVPSRRGGSRSVPTFTPGGRRSFEKPTVHASQLMKQTMKMARQRNHMMTFKPGKR